MAYESLPFRFNLGGDAELNRVYFNNHMGHQNGSHHHNKKTTRIKFKVVRRLETINTNCAVYSIYSHALLTKNDQEYFSSRKTIQKTRPKMARHILPQTRIARVSTPHRDNTSRHEYFNRFLKQMSIALIKKSPIGGFFYLHAPCDLATG